MFKPQSGGEDEKDLAELIGYLREQKRHEERRLHRRRLCLLLALALAVFGVVLEMVRMLNGQAPWGPVVLQASITASFVWATAAGEIRYQRSVSNSKKQGRSVRADADDDADDDDGGPAIAA